MLVVAAKKDYAAITELLQSQEGETSIEQRKSFAAKAFEIVGHYDVAIAKYFNSTNTDVEYFFHSETHPKIMRYGENPHQQGIFYGDLDKLFTQLNGKELSYNNLVDVDAAVQLIAEFPKGSEIVFAIIKHTNVCGVASRKPLLMPGAQLY